MALASTWICSTFHRRKPIPGTVELGQKPMTGKIIGHSRKLIIIALLNEHDVKLPPRYLCLSLVLLSALAREVSFSTGQWLTQRLITGKGAENK